MDPHLLTASLPTMGRLRVLDRCSGWRSAAWWRLKARETTSVRQLNALPTVGSVVPSYLGPLGNDSICKSPAQHRRDGRGRSRTSGPFPCQQPPGTAYVLSFTVGHQQGLGEQQPAHRWAAAGQDRSHGGRARDDARCTPFTSGTTRSCALPRGRGRGRGARSRGVSPQHGHLPSLPNRDGGRRSARPVALCLETVSKPCDRVRPSGGDTLSCLRLALPPSMPPPLARLQLAGVAWTSPANRGPLHRGVQWPPVTLSWGMAVPELSRLR